MLVAGDIARLSGGAVVQSDRDDVLSARSPPHLAQRSNQHAQRQTPPIHRHNRQIIKSINKKEK